MSDYEIHDPRFAKLIIGHAKLERLWTGSRWAEGPVYAPAARQVLWSDIPNNRVLRFVEDDASVSVFEAPSGHQNGHALDAEGRSRRLRTRGPAHLAPRSRRPLAAIGDAFRRQAAQLAQ